MSTENKEGKKKEGTFLGGLGLIGILLFKFKVAIFAILKFGWLAKSFLSIILTIGIYSMFFGWPYAVAVVFLILIHEGGHFIWMLALGLGPKAPIFIPGVGAFTAMNNLPPDAVTRAWVAFAGPLVGGVCSAAMYWGGGQLNNGWLMAAGSIGFLLNLLQLIPAKPLDGGFVILAISRWLLLPGSILLCAVALMFHSILFGIIGIFSLFNVVKQLFGKGPTDESVIAASIPQRFVIGVAYLALAGMLAYLYTLSQTTVMDVIRQDPRGRQTIHQIAPAQHHQTRSEAHEQGSDANESESDQNEQPLDQQSDNRSDNRSDNQSDK